MLVDSIQNSMATIGMPEATMHPRFMGKAGYMEARGIGSICMRVRTHRDLRQIYLAMDIRGMHGGGNSCRI
jgi:hypothetical protein